MLREMLDKADENEDFDPALHERILNLLDETPADKLSLTEKFRLAQYLQNAVLYIAKQNDWSAVTTRPDGKGGRREEKVVDEARLPFEMAALHKIQDTLHYSPALGQWIAGQRDKLAARLMNDDSFSERLFDWDKSTAEQKRQLLQDIVALHMTAYDGPVGVTIPVPPVQINDKFEGPCAATHNQLGGESEKIPGVASIDVSPDLLGLPKAYLPLKLVYHESVHALITQLAAARARGTLSPDDPLYGDASLALAERLDGVATPLIRSVYENDVEEKFVYGCEHDFGDSLMEQIAARHKKAPPAPALAA